jgi:hypothetical protein
MEGLEKNYQVEANLLTQRSHARDVHPYRSLNRLGRQKPEGACGANGTAAQTDFLASLPVHARGAREAPSRSGSLLKIDAQR